MKLVKYKSPLPISDKHFKTGWRLDEIIYFHCQHKNKLVIFEI